MIRLAAALALLVAPAARAELVAVSQPASGMECPECSRGLRVSLRTLDGLDDLDTSWNRRVVTARFRPGSRATLHEIRAIIRAAHFTPRDAEVTVGGTLAWRGAQLVVELSGSGVVYAVQDGSRSIRDAGPLPLGQPVLVVGMVPAVAKGKASEDPLVLRLARIEPRR